MPKGIKIVGMAKKYLFMAYIKYLFMAYIKYIYIKH